MVMVMPTKLTHSFPTTLSWPDTDVDGDTIPDELDAYPNDATQSLDSDGDSLAIITWNQCR